MTSLPHGEVEPANDARWRTRVRKGYPEHSMSEPIISSQRVSRLYRSEAEEIRAVDEVSMSVDPGEFVLIRGRSGSGKTTLLSLMGGLETPSQGHILYKGRDIGSFSSREMTIWRRQEVAFVFQAYALVPELSAWENVDLRLRIRGKGPGESKQEALEALDRVGLSPRAHHRVYELSGGEQQRVAIARGLVGESRVVFADEPTGELDQETTIRIGAVLRSVAEGGVAMLVASHDPLLMETADRILELRDGRLVSEGKTA